MTNPSVRTEPVTRIFTFGYGHTCPFTGESLAGKYFRITAPNYELCRLLMFKVFGRDWTTDYSGLDDPRLRGYGPTLTQYGHMTVGAPLLRPGVDYTRADDEGPAEDMTVTRFGRGDETGMKPMPGCLPGCRRTDREYGKGSSAHADGCPEWAAAKAREADGVGRGDEAAPGLIVGDTAEEEMGNAYAAYERDEAELRETVHWRTGYLVDLVIACGAEGGLFTQFFDKVTCQGCLAAMRGADDETPTVACHTCGGAARVVDGDLVHVGEHGQMVLPAHPHDASVG